jgi:hypothetical protein
MLMASNTDHDPALFKCDGCGKSGTRVKDPDVPYTPPPDTWYECTLRPHIGHFCTDCRDRIPSDARDVAEIVDGARAPRAHPR